MSLLEFEGISNRKTFAYMMSYSFRFQIADIDSVVCGG
jgi:hypothetical protein